VSVETAFCASPDVRPDYLDTMADVRAEVRSPLEYVSDVRHRSRSSNSHTLRELIGSGGQYELIGLGSRLQAPDDGNGLLVVVFFCGLMCPLVVHVAVAETDSAMRASMVVNRI
jgi:hypothetical protein